MSLSEVIDMDSIKSINVQLQRSSNAKSSSVDCERLIGLALTKVCYHDIEKYLYELLRTQTIQQTNSKSIQNKNCGPVIEPITTKSVQNKNCGPLIEPMITKSIQNKNCGPVVEPITTKSIQNKNSGALFESVTTKLIQNKICGLLIDPIRTKSFQNKNCDPLFEPITTKSFQNKNCGPLIEPITIKSIQNKNCIPHGSLKRQTSIISHIPLKRKISQCNDNTRTKIRKMSYSLGTIIDFLEGPQDKFESFLKQGAINVRDERISWPLHRMPNLTVHEEF